MFYGGFRKSYSGYYNRYGPKSYSVAVQLKILLVLSSVASITLTMSFSKMFFGGFHKCHSGYFNPGNPPADRKDRLVQLWVLIRNASSDVFLEECA